MPLSLSLGTRPVPPTVCSAQLSVVPLWALEALSALRALGWAGLGSQPQGSHGGRGTTSVPLISVAGRSPGTGCAVASCAQSAVSSECDIPWTPTSYPPALIISVCWETEIVWYHCAELLGITNIQQLNLQAKVMHKVWPTEGIFCRIIITTFFYCSQENTNLVWCAPWTKQGEPSHTAPLPSSALGDPLCCVCSWGEADSVQCCPLRMFPVPLGQRSATKSTEIIL